MKVVLVIFAVIGPNTYTIPEQGIQVEPEICMSMAYTFNLKAQEEHSIYRAACFPVVAPTV